MTDPKEMKLLRQKMYEEKKEAVTKLSAIMRKQKARCDRYCGTWNSKDKDCEIYGEHHPSPANCRYFLETELEKRGVQVIK